MEGEVRWEEAASAPGDDSIRLRGARIVDASGRTAGRVDVRTGFELQMEYEVYRRVRGLQVGFLLCAQDGTAVLTSGDTEALNGAEAPREPGCYVARCTMPGRLLSPGTYSLSLGAHIPRIRSCYFVESALNVTVTETLASAGDGRRRGVVSPPLEWSTDLVEECTAACGS
jgi:lipopolysaccharide transport system ATP-binding protein